jgi:tight adherence protein B
MTVALVASAMALVVGAPLPVVGAGLLVAVAPGLLVPALALLVAVGLRSRRRSRPTGEDEAAFLRRVAAELSGGASVRSALVAASAGSALGLRSVARTAAAGRPASEVAAAVEAALPSVGRVAAAAVELAATNGGSSADVFRSAAVLAADRVRLQREAHTGTAAARASAMVVAGLPVAVVVGMAVTGRFGAASDPAVLAVVTVGLALQALGVAAMWAMMRRSLRVAA